MNDEQTVQCVLSGDREAFRGILEKYQGPVFRLVRHLVGHEQASEDIAQDVFVTAYMRLDSFDPMRSRFATWLFTIARNQAINALKKKRPACMAQVPDTLCERNPADMTAEKEMFEALDRALRGLPGRLRRALIWAEFEQLPYEDIAQIEGVRLGTIKSRVSRARIRLRALLQARESHADR